MAGRHLSSVRCVDVDIFAFSNSSRFKRLSFKEAFVSDIFGSILGTALRGLAGQAGGLPAVLSQVLGKTDLGSIGGLLQQLQQSGLGPQVASWLGNGQNLPISVDQLKNALGDQNLRQLATQFGLPVDQLLGELSRHLPGAIDHMSPNGSLEEQLGPG
jgi:uncharacterized protein YidB (DUF937 family)